MTVNEAAAALGLQPVTIRAAIARGRLRATMHGRDHWITPKAVEAYREGSLGRIGRPRNATAICETPPIRSDRIGR